LGNRLFRKGDDPNLPGCESRASFEIQKNMVVVDSLLISLRRPLPWAQYGFSVAPMDPDRTAEPNPAK
jgi:hypothetical protein